MTITTKELSKFWRIMGSYTLKEKNPIIRQMQDRLTSYLKQLGNGEKVDNTLLSQLELLKETKLFTPDEIKIIDNLITEIPKGLIELISSEANDDNISPGEAVLSILEIIENIEPSLLDAPTYSPVVMHTGAIGAEVHNPLPHGLTPLILAAYKGEKADVALLLQRGADINQILPDGDGRSPLFLAIENGHVDVARLLLKDKKIDINRALSNGLTPLMIAAQKGQIDVVRDLLAKGASIRVISPNVLTPLMRAAINGHAEVVDLLLDERGSFEQSKQAFGDDQITPLMFAAQKGHVDVVKVLLTDRYNVDVVARSSNGWTALLLAAEMGQAGVVEELLRNGRFTSRRDYVLPNGWTPLMIAVQNRDVKTLDVCLKVLTPSDLIEQRYDVALMIAAQQGEIEIVKTLLKKGKIFGKEVSLDNDLTQVPIQIDPELFKSEEKLNVTRLTNLKTDEVDRFIDDYLRIPLFTINGIKKNNLLISEINAIKTITDQDKKREALFCWFQACNISETTAHFLIQKHNFGVQADLGNLVYQFQNGNPPQIMMTTEAVRGTDITQTATTYQATQSGFELVKQTLRTNSPAYAAELILNFLERNNNNSKESQTVSPAIKKVQMILYVTDHPEFPMQVVGLGKDEVDKKIENYVIAQNQLDPSRYNKLLQDHLKPEEYLKYFCEQKIQKFKTNSQLYRPSRSLIDHYTKIQDLGNEAKAAIVEALKKDPGYLEKHHFKMKDIFFKPMSRLMDLRREGLLAFSYTDPAAKQHIQEIKELGNQYTEITLAKMFVDEKLNANLFKISDKELIERAETLQKQIDPLIKKLTIIYERENAAKAAPRKK